MLNAFSGRLTTREIAHRFFAPSEAAYLESVDQDQKETEFLKLWTLKEAFIKARGLGFAIPLNSFEIELVPGQPPCVSFVNGIHGKESDWQFLQIRLEQKFHVAIALAGPMSNQIFVRFSTMTPLAGLHTSISLEPNHLNQWALEEF